MARLHPTPDQRALFPVPQAAGLTPATPWFPSSFILCPQQTGLCKWAQGRGIFPSNHSPSTWGGRQLFVLYEAFRPEGHWMGVQ